MPTTKGEQIWVHKNFKKTMQEEYQGLRKELQETGKSLSFIDFTDFFGQCLQKKETVVNIQPTKAGRHSKKVYLDFL